MTTIRLLTAAITVAIGAGTGTALAQQTTAKSDWDHWHNFSIQYGYSWDAGNDYLLGYGSEKGDRHQIRLEIENIWKYGENYAYVDYIKSSGVLGGDSQTKIRFPNGQLSGFSFPCCGDPKNSDDQIFMLWNGNLSAQKLLGLPRGLIDVAAEGRLEHSTWFNYNGRAVGASLYLNLPGFVEKPGDKIQFTYWHRWNNDTFITSAAGGGFERYKDHNLWGLTLRKEWEMFGLNWQHQTFLRYQQAAGSKNDIKEAERFDRIFMENEIFAHVSKGLSVGFRSEYFRDEGGIDKKNGVLGETKDVWRPIIAVKYDLSSSD